MRKIYLLLMAFILFQLTSCETTEPQPPKEEKPPGYQEDIPWPSLADSPWPMFRGNPQYTGRSTFKGPKSGIINWDYDSVYIETGVIIAPDNSIIFQTSGPMSLIGGLYKLSQSGNLQWIYEIKEIAAGTTPLILADSTIVVSTYIDGKIIALTYGGEKKWSFDTGSYIISRGMNVGLDGTIYLIDSSRTLFALSKNGKLQWTLKIENSQGGNRPRMAFSPNGRTLYVTGVNKAIYAVDILQKNIIWEYGNHSLIASPIVDSQSNIYLYGVLNKAETNKISLIKLDPSGNVVWEHSISNNADRKYFFEPTIDINGNLYFGEASDSLYSINYEGVLRWKVEIKKTFGARITGALLCDSQNNIFFPIGRTDPVDRFKILAYKSDGTFLWQTCWLIGEPGDSPALGIGSLFFPTYRWFDLYSIR